MQNVHLRVLVIMFFLFSCTPKDKQPDAWGNFESVETIISAQIGGKLLEVNFDRGMYLKEDALAALIDTVEVSLNYRQLIAQKESIESRLGEVDANVAILKAQKQNLEREIARTRKLLEDNAATPQQLDDLKGKLLVLERQADAAASSKKSIKAEIQAMEAKIALARQKIDYCRINNPVDGVVLERYVEPHELLMPGKPIYKIAELSEMELRVYVSGSQLPNVGIGQKVKVFIDEDADNERQYEGRVSWISSKAEFTPKTIQTKEERVTQVYAVIITVKNDGSIKIGMPGEVVF